jgi:chaperonin GroES
MKIRPLADRIVVKRTQHEEKTKGGIIIPDSAKEKPVEGKVVAVGSGKQLKDGKVHPVDVKVGDRVLFGKYSARSTFSSARMTSSACSTESLTSPYKKTR